MRAFFSCVAWRAIPSPLSKLKRRLDSLEATQWAPRDPCRNSRGEWSPLLPLETRPDSPREPGMQPRDPCLPWRGILGSGHTPRCRELAYCILSAALSTASSFRIWNSSTGILSLPGASVRNSAHDKGHEERGLAYAKAGLSLRSPPGNSRASTPKTRVCLLSALCFHLHL